jgi:hypothetical protein
MDYWSTFALRATVDNLRMARQSTFALRAMVDKPVKVGLPTEARV